MRALRGRRMAVVLLLAALAQPGWAVAHAALHHHLAHHHAEQPASAPDPQEGETRSLVSPERPHDHDHLVAVFLLPTRSSDVPAPAALLLATPRPDAAHPQRWHLHREAAASCSSPEESGPFAPRAPPIAWS